MTEIDWPLLGRYAAGDCTVEESARIERYLNELPEYRAGLEAIRRVTAGARRSTSIEERVTRLERLRRTIAAESIASAMSSDALPRPRWRAHDVRLWATIAAVVLLVAGTTLAMYLLVRHPSPSALTDGRAGRAGATARGERMSLRLSDGTLVVLGERSTLDVTRTRGAESRTVRLDGEAEFTVAPDPRPFVVTTRRLLARDLGTRFVVRAYTADSIADVVVAEGRVAVARVGARAASLGESVVLARGQRARVTGSGRMAIADRVPLDPYVPWRADRVVFRSTPLEAVVAQITRWRNVHVDLEAPAGLRSGPFIGVFEARTSTRDVLRTLAAMYGLYVEEIGPRHFALRVPQP